MAGGKIIRALKPSGDITGEIKRVNRDIRLMAVRGAGRLPPGMNVTFLYMMLYDSDGRVRALAEEGLINLTPDDINAFISLSGHHKVLDFMAHILPKNSPALEHIAHAPSLAKRTIEYLEMLGIPPRPMELFIQKKAIERADEGTWGSSLEWKPGADVDLPDGVEFEMPTEDEVPLDRSPAESAGDMPQVEVNVSKTDNVVEIKSQIEAGQQAEEIELEPLDKKTEAPVIEKKAEEKEIASSAKKEDKPVVKAADKPAPARTEKPPTEAQKPAESPKQRMIDKPFEEDGKPLPRVTRAAPEGRKFAAPPSQASAPRKEIPPDKLFPVHGAEPEKRTASTVNKKAAAAPGMTKQSEVRSEHASAAAPPAQKNGLVKWIIYGVLIGLLLAAGFVAFDHFVPDWPNKFRSKPASGESVVKPEPGMQSLFQNEIYREKSQSRNSINRGYRNGR